MDKPLRHIGVLCTTRALGGMELNLLRLAGWLAGRGWETSAFGLSGASFVTQSRSMGIAAEEISPYSKYFDFCGAKALAASLKARKVDVLFLSANRDINAAVLAKRFFYPALKVVYLQQMQLGIPKKDMAHTWQYRRLDAWIAPLEWLAAQARENTRVQHAKIHVIPLCIETARFEDAPLRRAEARAALGLPQDAFIVGTVGRFDEGKHQDVLVDAAGLLAADGTAIDVLLVGEDTRDERQNFGLRLQERADAERIADRVHFRPFRSDVEIAYAAMDAFAMTTPAETFGMVTIEAMAAGIPVIAANGGGSPELLDFGKAGVLVPPRDPSALAEAIRMLRNDPARSAVLAAAGKARTAARYAHSVQCEQTEALLSSLFA